MFSVVTRMHEALIGIERVDKLIFPLLNLKNPCLNAPDVKNDIKLKLFTFSIKKLIEEGLRKAHIKV